MKLRTEMQDGCVHALGCCVDENDVLPSAAEDLQHDAAVAHALVRAINEIGVTKDGMYAECCVARDTQCFLWERANELLAEWGFGEEEDERG